MELDLTCCCLHLLLWEENQIETEPGAWQIFLSSPYSSSNISGFLALGSVHGQVFMPLLIAE